MAGPADKRHDATWRVRWCRALRSRLSFVRRRIVLILGALVVFGSATAAAWGLPPFTTAPKSSPPGAVGQAELYSVTVGCHATYDRLVLRFRFAKPGYNVRAVAQVTEDASGKPVRLLGNARLLVVARGARGHSANGTVNFLPPASPRSARTCARSRRWVTSRESCRLALASSTRRAFGSSG